MKKRFLLGLGFIFLLLAACSNDSVTLSPQAPIFTDPGTAPIILEHQSPAVPNNHRATVFGRKENGSYVAPNSYITTYSSFEVDLGLNHPQGIIRVNVSPNSSKNPIVCSWKNNQFISCSSLFGLSPNTLYTVSVEENQGDAKVAKWVLINTSYFRTDAGTGFAF
jgi:hypothetical protein